MFRLIFVDFKVNELCTNTDSKLENITENSKINLEYVNEKLQSQLDKANVQLDTDRRNINVKLDEEVKRRLRGNIFRLLCYAIFREKRPEYWKYEG